jgi:predicted transcriptional regulator of viral defense system
LYPGLDDRRLYEWHKKGYIIKLRNSWYCLPEFLKEHYSTWIIANVVHKPSYIRLESAMSYHGLIPEGVFMTTSISTNRSVHLSMAGSSYSFSSLKKELFFGYELIETEKYHRMLKVAEPEKAILDFFHLHPQYNSENEILQLRFNGPLLRDLVHEEKLMNSLELFQNRKLDKRIATMLKAYSDTGLNL